MDKLVINLFGVFEARAEGVPIRMPTRRVELILALLALTPDKAISRSYLAALLWPGQEDAQARASLRQALFRLRGALGAANAPAVETTAGWVKLRRDAVVLDLDAIADRRDTHATAPEGLPLDGLSGFEPEIEDLLDTARADLRRQLVAWLAAASRQAEQQRRHTDLEGYARRRLALETYDEAALRDLMTALSRQGQRNAALHAFREISQRIRTDLSVSVEAETLDLYQSIRSSNERQPVPADATAPVPGAADHGSGPDRLDVQEPKDVAATEAPAHLRHLAVVHVTSERLRVALRDPDPESAEAGSRAAIADIEAAIAREGGETIGRAGHHLSAVFGARRPDESPALSAALAAFEIAGQDCAVGIHAGPALVGARSETFPLVHLAQSLAALAASGEVRVTAEIESACRGAFELGEAPPLSDDAEGPAVPNWRLERETTARGGFDIRKARGLSRFCGRRDELARLDDVAARTAPRIAVVIGEAGIGKSRLVHEFLRERRPATLLRIQFARSELGGGLARYAGILRGLLGAEPDIPGRQVLERLTDRLAVPGIAEGVRPALAGILDEGETMLPWLDLPRSQRIQALADALLTVIEALTPGKTVLLVEDAHWADEDAGLLLERLVLSLQAAGPMLIVTKRTGQAESWQGHDHVQSLTLRPLDQADAAALLDTTDLPVPVRSAVLARGGGVPLFLEELSRAAANDTSLFDGHRSASPADTALPEVPAPLRGILSHRIDSLPGPARRVLDAAAVLGAEPTDEILTALCGLRRDAYETAISTLSDADLLYRIRTYPQRSYAFKHALIQDAAYLGILPRRRAGLHADVVTAHDERGGADALDDAALARHALEGGLLDRAIDFAMRSARDATERSAYAMANRMTDVALDAISRSPSSEAMLRYEADILTWRRALLWPLSLRSRMEAGLERAEDIARELGDDRRLADVSIHRAYLHSDDGKPELGLEYAAQARSAAMRAGDAGLLAECALARCQILSLQGKMRAALEAIKDHVHAWDDRRHALDGLLVTRYVMLHFHLARIHGALGNGETAWSHTEKTAATAIETTRPVDRYVACRVIAELCAMAGANEMAMSAFTANREIAARAELPAYVAWAEAESAELALEFGDPEPAMRDLRRLLETGGQGLLRIAQIKARAALACASSTPDERSVALLEDVLEEAEAVDLPMVRIKLLRRIASQTDTIAPEEAARRARMADAIVAAEGYRRVAPPAAARVEALLKSLARAG